MNQRPDYSILHGGALMRPAALVGCLMMAFWLLSQGAREEKAERSHIRTQEDQFTPRSGSVIKPDTALLMPRLMKCSGPVSNFTEARTATEKRALADALIDRGTEAAIREWGRALLAETDPDCRQAMLESLDTLNSEAAIEMITQLVEISEDPVVTLAVTRALSRLATPDTVEYLSEIYARAAKNPSCQQRVLDVIGSIRNPAAVAGLVMVANQPELGHALTGQAFSSLGKIGNPTCLLAISSAYQTLAPEHFAQRHQAIHAISCIQNPESFFLLQELAGGINMPAVAIAAADALQNMFSGQVGVR